MLNEREEQPAAANDGASSRDDSAYPSAGYGEYIGGYSGGYAGGSYYGYQPLQRERPLREYTAVLYQHRYLMIACIVIGLTTAFIINRRSPKIYSATSSVNVGVYVPAVAGPMAEILRAESISAEYVNSLIPLTKSYVLLNYSLNRFPELRHKLDPEGKTDALFEHPKTREKAEKNGKNVEAGSYLDQRLSENTVQLPLWILDTYGGYISAQYLDQTNIIRITAQGSDPELLGMLVDRHAQAFIEVVRERRKGAASINLDYLTEKLNQAENYAAERHRAVVDFVQSNDLRVNDATSSVNVAAEKFRGLIASLGEVVQLRASTDGELRELQSTLGTRNARISESMQPSFLRLTELKGDYDILKRQQPSHPYLRELGGEIRVLERTIRKKNEEDVQARQITLKALEERERVLKENIEELKRTEVRDSALMIEYRMLKAQQEKAESVLEEAKKRVEDAMVNIENNQSTVTIVDRGHVPQYPIGPNLRSNLTVGGFSGTVAGLTIALTLDYFSNAIRSVAELGRLSGVQVIGVVPTLARRRRRKKKPGAPAPTGGRAPAVRSAVAPGMTPETTATVGPGIESAIDSQLLKVGIPLEEYEEMISLETVQDIFCVSAPLSRESEAFRNIRTTLRYSSRGGVPQTILVTSGQKGDGKSTVAVNLAASLAQASASTLLIDSDLRLPTIHKYFSQPRETIGLSEYLSGTASLDEVLRYTELAKLSVIYAGGKTELPAELLESSRMRALLEILCLEYEHIIIDTPPVCNVTDALLLAGIADGTIVVARSGVTPGPVVTFGVGRLRQVNARLLGCILNDVSKSTAYREADYYYMGNHYYS